MSGIIGGNSRAAGPYPTTPPNNVGIDLPTVYTFSTLPAASLYPDGTLVYTSDAGYFYAASGAWVAIGTGGGGGGAGRLAVNVPAGVNNNFNPGLLLNVTRILANPNAGNAELTGMLAGGDGQDVLLWNAQAIGGNTIQLDNLNAGSTAANRFSISGPSFTINPQSGARMKYDTTLGLWLVS